MLISFQEQI